jgi:FkbM family methyltransferase
MGMRRTISGRRRGTASGSSAVRRYLIQVILGLVVVVTLVSFVIPQLSNLDTGSGLVTSSSISTNQKVLIHDDLIVSIPHVSADVIWEMLLEEASAITARLNVPFQRFKVIEVGMFNSKQCRLAAKMGMEAHCVEASPHNFGRIGKELLRVSVEDGKDRVHVYHNAAGSKSNQTVEFQSGGSTGDHVGVQDMFTMEKVKSDSTMVKVATLAIDDLIDQIGGNVFLLKIDTQGFEPQVFSGLQKAIQSHKVQYILTEYWPRGIDLLSGTPNACSAHTILRDLINANYTIYQMSDVAHPAAGKIRVYRNIQLERPVDDLLANCKWYFGLEDIIPNPEYKMGYWTDILAVAPPIGKQRIEKPITVAGQVVGLYV